MKSTTIDDLDFEARRAAPHAQPAYAETLWTSRKAATFKLSSDAAPSGQESFCRCSHNIRQDSLSRRVNLWRQDVAESLRLQAKGRPAQLTRPVLSAGDTRASADGLYAPYSTSATYSPPNASICGEEALRGSSGESAALASSTGLSSPMKIIAKLPHLPSEAEQRQIIRAFEALKASHS